MKRYLLSAFGILLMLGAWTPWLFGDVCPGGREVSTPNEQYCLVVKDGKEVKHGVYKEFYADGSPRTLGEFSYGDKTGAWTAWDEKGRKVLEEHYLNGLQHGTIQKWYANGRLALQGRYENGKPVGERLEWQMDGGKMARNVYTHAGDDVHAVRTTWYDNGQEESSAAYTNGRLNGMEKRWHKNGRPRSEAEYTAGQKNGVCRQWYPDGREKALDHYVMGKKEGVSVEWHDNGVKKAEGAWKNGRDGLWTFREKDGTIREQASYKEGKRID